ncbi:MAG: sigma-70 family RNA polymerase sigma factor [Gemmatimonadetes bacterium]|nr:sigma-70 family RNA polymerase sigma factor [Gemmatimonadota bacterium]
MDKERQVLPLVRPATRLEGEADIALLYRQMQGDLTRYAARLVDPEEVEDVVHDAILKFLAQRERERERARDGGREALGLAGDDARIRLMVMVRDVAIDRYRNAQAQSRLMRLITGPSATIRRWMNTRRSADDNDIRFTIQEALRGLPEYIREPWLLVVEFGYSYKEAAAHLNIDTGTCRACVSRANARLREQLTADGLTPDALRGREVE